MPAQGDAQPDSSHATGATSNRLDYLLEDCRLSRSCARIYLVSKVTVQVASQNRFAPLKVKISVRHSGTAVGGARELRSELDLSAAVAKAASSTENQTA